MDALRQLFQEELHSLAARCRALLPAGSYAAAGVSHPCVVQDPQPSQLPYPGRPPHLQEVV
jgi:hypothetical protein